MDLSTSSVTHPLVSNTRRQDRAQHCSTVSDVAIEKQNRVCDLRHLILGINEIDESSRVFVSQASMHMVSNGRLCSEACSSGKVIVAGIWFHVVGNEHMLSVLQEVLLCQRQICVSARLVWSVESDRQGSG